MNFRMDTLLKICPQYPDLSRFLVRLAMGIFASVLLSGVALAQTYPGGTAPMGTAPGGTYTPPAGGYSSSAGIGIGVGAAAGAGVLYLALRHRGMVTGCVEQRGDGLALMDEKHNQTYLLMPGDTGVKVGEQVKIKGKKVKGDDGGAQMFEAKKLIKDLGACNPASAADTSPSPAKQPVTRN